MSTETEFEQDVTTIVRKVLTQEVRNIQINLEDQLTEKLNDILKSRDAEQDKKVAANARQPIEIAPVIYVYNDTVDPVKLALQIATTENKTVAVVYKDAASIPATMDVDGYENQIRMVTKSYGNQAIHLRHKESVRAPGPTVYLRAPGLDTGRGLSVNLVLYVPGRPLTLSSIGLLGERANPPEDPATFTPSEQVYHNVLHVVPDSSGEAIPSMELIGRVRGLGGVIHSDHHYLRELEEMVRKGIIKRRFRGQWLYYRDA